MKNDPLGVFGEGFVTDLEDQSLPAGEVAAGDAFPEPLGYIGKQFAPLEQFGTVIYREVTSVDQI